MKEIYRKVILKRKEPICLIRSRYLRSEVTDDDSDSSTQRRLASDGGGRGGGGGLESSVEERSLIPYSAPVLLPKSTTSFRNGGGLHGNNFSAELEALDWTLKGMYLSLNKNQWKS